MIEVQQTCLYKDAKLASNPLAKTLLHPYRYAKKSGTKNAGPWLNQNHLVLATHHLVCTGIQLASRDFVLSLSRIHLTLCRQQIRPL